MKHAKSIFVLTALIVSLILITSLNMKRPNIIGNWKHYNDGIETTLSFSEENLLEIMTNDNNGSTVNVVKGFYKINLQKKPIPLDISYFDKKDYSLFTAIRFINNNEIKISRYTNNWKTRVLSFDNGTITFKREK
jgi:hypothetical protein